RLLAVGQAVADALLDQPADVAHGLLAQVAPDDVAPQGQRQAGLLLPPDAEVYGKVQALVLKGELPLVDDEPRIELAGGDRGNDLVERHDLVAKALRQQ